MALIECTKCGNNVSDTAASCSGMKKPRNTIILTAILIIFITAIIFCAKFISDHNITKYRVTYNSNEEMLRDLYGTWELYDFQTKQLLGCYLIFDDTNSEIFVSYDDHDNIDMKQNNTITLTPKDATITIMHNDGTLSDTAVYDVVEYDGKKYVRMNTKEANPNNWLPFKKVSQSTDIKDTQ